MERSKNKQLAINLSASIVSFAVNLGIAFFLTPFIVKSLGAAAYGFVGLSNNIITYTQLFTIALNSMASRFITIKYVEGDIKAANKYFSSVFYSNLLLSGFIGLLLSFFIIYMQYFLDVPQDLLFDVKLLMGLLSFNYLISLIFNIYSVATFVKNRLELASIRQIVANIFRAFALFLLFSLLTPHIWYIGFVGFIVTLYVSYTNFRFTRRLTPELKVKRVNFDWSKVKDLISSGIWNTISQLGTIMGQGLDLLIANLLIGATEMGIFSISRQIPFYIISMSGTLAGVFAPSLTKSYAEKNIDVMKSEINKSVRINSLFIIIPLSFIIVWGKEFFSLWVPSQDANMLQLLSVLCGLELIFSLPFEVLWSVFTVTNKLKFSTIFMLCNHLLTFIIVLVGVQVTDDIFVKLIILASTRTILGVVRSLTFLPIYGAKCLGVSPLSFYQSILRISIAFIVVIVLTYLLHIFFEVYTWLGLIEVGLISMLICLATSSLIILKKSDREYILQKIKI